MKLGEPDKSGRRSPEKIWSSEFVLDAGLVISAVGEEPDLAFLSANEASIVDKNYIKADPLTLATSIKGVFAGGDIVTGPATVIQALAAGRKAAKSIDKFLKGEPLDAGREGEEDLRDEASHRYLRPA